jgi:uncharacterized protein DUF6788
MNPAQSRQLSACHSRIRQLADELSESAGFVCSGSLVLRHMRCGRSNCRCHADPPQLHGPYWQWSYRPTGGKTVSRQVGERQADLYREWIANRRRLIALIDEMEEVSRQAAEILLAEPPTPAPAAAMPTSRPTTVTRHLAQAVAQVAELIEPVAEAVQEWLESKDDGDREAVAEARERLLAALSESPDLASTLARLARLLGTAAWPR